MKVFGNKYELVMQRKMSSIEDVKAFAREILLENGIDIDLVNIRDEGISIKSFSSLVKALYEIGYKDGVEQNANILAKKSQMEKEGKMLTKHQRTARFMFEKSQINK